MIKIDPKKLSEFTDVEDLLTERYGAPGTPSREAFHAEAKAWYLGELMRERRKELKMTQQQLADKVGTARSYIARVEKGQSDVQMSTFFKIAAALGIVFNPVFL